MRCPAEANTGGDFVLTTVGNATFSGANVEGEHLVLDIGGNLTVESLQDIVDSSSKSSGFGLSLSNINPSTLVKNPTSSLSGSFNASKSVGEQEWVSNQTSLVGREGGTINVGNTLTNTGSIIGSLNAESPMVINAKEIVVNDLKDKDYSKNSGFGLSGITTDLKVPQASVQYGMSDKRQDTNSTFVNTIAYENGVKVDFEERGINTSLDNAQVITRDKEIEQIDTTLHTDMLNQSTRQQFVIDFLKTTTLVPQVAKGIGQGINNKELGQNVLGQLANNLGKNGFNIVAYAYDVDEKLKNIIEDHYINGKYGVGLDEYNMSEIAGLLKPLLAEYGKDFYDIKFVKAEDIVAGMSINDKDGVVYINTYGDGFGHSSEMLEQLGHEGMHGTYADKNVDEKAASMLTKIPSKGWSSSIGATAITINAQGMIEASTSQYYKDRVNGDLRDIIVSREVMIDGKYEKDDERERIFKQYNDFAKLPIEDFKTLIMYEQLSEEEEKKYLESINHIGLDVWDVDINDENGRRILKIETLATEEELNLDINKEKKVITLILREMAKEDYYFSLQGVSEDKIRLRLENEQIYDLLKKEKISFVYLNNTTSQKKYVTGYDRIIDEIGIENRNIKEEIIGTNAFLGHELVGHGYDVISYFNSSNAKIGQSLIMFDPKYYENTNMNFTLDYNKNVFSENNIFVSKVGNNEMYVLPGITISEFNAIHIENIVYKSENKSPRITYLDSSDVESAFIYDNTTSHFLHFNSMDEIKEYIKESNIQRTLELVEQILDNSSRK
ncbi:hemagglutinin repeat-containing protein [Fusobacterium sp. PH5-44]|uniref:hemagglutinin repeat-containing protein n=1 Tax=unclassified Fusobacterium TaxID=2648384 RepID=UPI003D21A0E9